MKSYILRSKEMNARLISRDAEFLDVDYKIDALNNELKIFLRLILSRSCLLANKVVQRRH